MLDTVASRPLEHSVGGRVGSEPSRQRAARLAAVCLAGLGRPRACVASEEGEALRAIRDWLGLIDRSRYAASWGAGAPPLRDTVGEAGWTLALQTSRAPLGQCLWRRPAGTSSLADPATDLDQAFVVVRFESRFETAEEVEETVATVRCPDGRWRVAGYFIGASEDAER